MQDDWARVGKGKCNWMMGSELERVHVDCGKRGKTEAGN